MMLNLLGQGPTYDGIDQAIMNSTTTSSQAKLRFNPNDKSYCCEGSWSISNLAALKIELQTIEKSIRKNVTINGAALEYFDSAGALLLYRLIHRLRAKGSQVELVHFSSLHENLLDLIAENKENIDYQVPKPFSEALLATIGKETILKIDQTRGMVRLIGDLSSKAFAAAGQWKRFRFTSIVSNIQSAGLQALPILALLSFLIGVVLAYQMGLQLKTYGANTYIAFLSGMAIFREFGPLITAIIVAGRTSSAYTAQIGSMKIKEEIDALRTMGLSPTELLVMPKVIGLTLVFPLLIFWSDCFSILGSMLMSKWQLNITYADFLIRLQESLKLKQMMLGLYKAPAFSLIIALVGCFQGFAVEANADSIGAQTTKSVVQALFLIIIADAVYSLVYSWMDL